MFTYFIIYGLALFVPALLMVVSHYFPWQALRGKPLHPNEARVWGVGVIAATFSVLLFFLPTLTAILVIALLWACVVGAGVATLMVWAMDDWIAAKANAAGSQAQVQVYERQLQS